MTDEFVTSGRIERAIERSAIVGATTRARSAIERAISGLEEAIDRSRVRRYIDRVGSGIGDATAHATVVAGVSTIANVARSSFLYRWLTAEPDPAVIVIDLRDTVTVGPVVAAMDASFRYADSWLPTSTVARWAGETAAIFRERPIRATSVTVFAAATTSLLASVVTGPVDTGVFLGYALVLGIAALGYRDTRSWDEVRETRPARLLVAVLEPPEPPESLEPPENGSGDD